MDWRRWPWTTETRAGYTDAVTTALYEAAADPRAHAGAVAAVRAVSGVLARGLMAAAVEPDDPATRALSVSVRGEIGRRVIEYGESLHELRVTGGTATLHLVTEWERRGGWYYVGDKARRVSPQSMLHVKWPGGPPWAGLSGELAAGLERQLRDESKQQSGSLLTLPDPGTGEEDKQGQGLGPMNQFLGQLQAMKGRRLTFRGDWHEDKVPEIAETRLGLSPPQAAVLLRQHLAQDLVAACGLPAALLAENATGEGLREVGRHALHWLLLPAGRLVEAAASELLDRDVTLDFDALMAGDLRSRGQFVNGSRSWSLAASTQAGHNHARRVPPVKSSAARFARRGRGRAHSAQCSVTGSTG